METNFSQVTFVQYDDIEPVVTNVKPKAFILKNLEPIKPKKGSPRKNHFPKIVKRRNRTTIH